MPLNDLYAKYGHTRTSKEVLNRAIRAELVGGEDCLDSLEKVNRLAVRLTERRLAGSKDARSAMHLLTRVRDAMAGEIRRRYGIATKSTGGE